jgi:hypothetical protein
MSAPGAKRVPVQSLRGARKTSAAAVLRLGTSAFPTRRLMMGMRVGGAASGAAQAAWQAKTAAPAASATPAPAAAASAAQATAGKQVQADMQALATGSSFSLMA